jgi:hypothetical protein
MFFEFCNFAFVHRVVVLLGHWVVDDVLVLYKLVGYFFVLGWFILQVAFFVQVVIHVMPPLLNSIRQTECRCDSSDVSCHLNFNSFNY